jgi:hypothetical protein
MAFTLNDIVPWGRSYDEYVRMFALEETELRLRILGCGDGPASFNAEAAGRGMQVISCDPLYAFGAAAVRERIDATSPDVLEQTRKNAAEFLEDYDPESAEGSSGRRYVAAALPDLPFLDAAFDLALCSHFLFLYSDHLGADFHADAVCELCRVAREVRIFPLLSLDGERSPFVETIRETLTGSGKVVSLELVPYEFQRGGNQMMRIRR